MQQVFIPGPSSQQHTTLSNGVCLISKTPYRHPAFFPRWSKLHSKQGNDGEPSPASFSYERPPSRAAAGRPRRGAIYLISGLSGLVLWRRGGRFAVVA